MAWRLYARRTTTGEWLHTDVPAAIDVTGELNGTGYASAFIPAALDVDKAADGEPLWLERGTTLYAEDLDSGELWVGLCTWQQPTALGRTVEFKGLTHAHELIGFDGVIREWQPDPFEVVGRLVNNAQAQPDGDVGLVVVTDGQPDTFAGDEQPPTERPPKVHRRRGETKDEFEKRQDDRQKLQAEWDKAYGDRRPYLCAWWEAPYVLEEVRELAREIPFDWYEQHRWTDRDQLEARHELVLTPRKGRDRADVALVEGVNVVAALDVVTDSDGYGNHVVMLGAGEGRKMRRAEIGSRDGRVRTTRFGEAKHVHDEKRLRARARDRFDRMRVSLRVDEATARGELGGLELGDRLNIDTSLFQGWARVYGITRSSRNGNVTLTFTPSGDVT